ncbi:cytochrome P450 alkane hydroxylase [Pleomassaria siparia CBS 279.74]|uniref:Cytochrome P450 alkane hydroxylase n=1 Tax=Pleomassaria siparia CBS 279.74 TaxID=1314801 RepID=A0A6G1KGS8_9PLEO|nr:cytochrome P450 alkane hydroxylase [Pleomassaria siparia CBS 279.74]
MTTLLFPFTFLAIVTVFLYQYVRRSRERQVSIYILQIHITTHNHYIPNLTSRQADDAIAKSHACLPAPRLQNQRPWGIDRLEQIFRADAEARLMEHFYFHFRQTGNTLEQNFLGTKAWGTVEPRNLECLLGTNFKDFSIQPRHAIASPMFGTGIFTQEGAAWKSSRDMLRPRLHHRHYSSLSLFQDAVDDLISIIEGGKGRVIDLQPLFFRLTLDTTTAFLFGESVKSLVTPDEAGEKTFASAFNKGQQWVLKRFRLADLYWLVGGREWRDACRDVQKFADEMVDRNLARDGKEKEHGEEGFLQAIAEHSKTRDELRGQIINLLAAGRDTTACLLSWTFFLLIRHPNVLLKLRAEIASTLTQNSSITRANLLQMPYLQNVLKETLRLYPPVPVNTRTALRTTILPTGGGPDRTSPVLIPKGSSVAFSVYAMHRRPDLYGTDAEIFRPERWDEDMPMQRNSVDAKWGFLPFHGGPRTCLGMDFALAEAGYTVVRLLQRFQDIKIPPGEKMEIVGKEGQVMTLVVAIKNGCEIMMR